MYEQKTQTFFVNSKKYNKDIKRKKIKLERTLKKTIQILDDQKKPISKVKVISNKVSIGETDNNGEIIFYYKLIESNKNFSINLSKRGFEPSEINFIPTEINNDYKVKLISVKKVLITVYDSESKETIGNKKIQINGQEHKTDYRGRIEYVPESNIGKLNYNYKGEDILHYSSSGVLSFDLSKRFLKIILKPQIVLIVESFYEYFGSINPLHNVQIKIDNNQIISTNKDGTVVIPISKDQKENGFNLNAKKKGYEEYNRENIYISGNPPYRERVVLRTIIGKFEVRDVKGDPITGIDILKSEKSIGNTNKWGIANIRLDELKKNTKYIFRDPKNRFKTKTLNFAFNVNKEEKIVELLPIPVKLTILLKKDIVDANADIFITPSPDPDRIKKSYSLNAGELVVDIYRPGNYYIRYEALPDMVVGDTNIYIGSHIFEKKKYELEFPDIPSEVSFRALIDSEKSNIQISAFLAKNYGDSKNQVFLGTFLGNGIDPFKHERLMYGSNIILKFKRTGWSKASEEIITINKPNELFKFEIGNEFSDCMEKMNSSKYLEACESCEKVKEESNNYCESRKILREIYYNQINDYNKGFLAAWDLVQISKCTNKYSDYIILFELASKSSTRKLPKEIRNVNTIVSYFDEANVMIPLQVKREKRLDTEISLKQATSSFAVTLLKYFIYKSDNATSNEESEEYIEKANNLFEYLKDRFVSGLPSGIKNKYLEDSNSLMKRL